ncbi:MAG: VPLPA-CTERM sorting domain-containing protein [Gammaproteobacteria bacterium]|nr:VPLPA-CTERM sorting domain-containing protein [Gammaproteobacteria bacterium]
MHPRHAMLVAATAVFSLPAHAVQLDLQLLNAFTASTGARNGSAEILDYSADQNTVSSTMAGTSGFGVQVLTLGNTGTLSERGIVTFNSAFGAGTVRDASSTALDPLQRGFGVVSLIPTTNGTTQGKIGFFDYRTGSVGALVTLDVGFHPDSVKFSADGTKLYVVNEGEFTSGGATDAPGSISIIDLSSISTIGDVSALTNAAVSTYDFQAANLGAGVSLSGIRYNDLSAGAVANLYRHIEPEFLTEKNGKLYVTLQENNAFAEFNLASNQWTAIRGLGTITQTIDASDRDGPGGTAAAQINDQVAGLPMPDTLASFEFGGKTYLVTANEGDFRVDDADRQRVAALPASGPGSVDATVAATLNSLYGGNYRANGALGRLRVSSIDGDTNGDGDIDVLTMTGTRSFSVWDAETGLLVKDSGSLESLLLSLDPLKHNITDGLLSSFDARSPDKGPEPEALALAEVGGVRLLFLGLERQNGLLAYDLTDPSNPVLLDYINSLSDGLIAPESLLFVAASRSPTGRALLLGGYESGGGGIGVYSATIVPIPAALPLFGAGLAVLGLVRRRRVATS